MRIEFTGRQTDVAEPLKRLGERRLSKLSRLLPGITRAHVILSTDRHLQVAEVNVRSPRLDLAAQEASNDLGASLAAAFDKVERQARHHVGKRQDRKRRAGSPRAERGGRAARPPKGEASPPSREASRGGLRVRRVVVQSMPVSTATFELERRSEGFVLFLEARSRRLSVLYRGKDGRLALIEPEV